MSGVPDNVNISVRSPFRLSSWSWDDGLIELGFHIPLKGNKAYTLIRGFSKGPNPEEIVNKAANLLNSLPANIQIRIFKKLVRNFEREFLIHDKRRLLAWWRTN